MGMVTLKGGPGSMDALTRGLTFGSAPRLKGRAGNRVLSTARRKKVPVIKQRK